MLLKFAGYQSENSVHNRARRLFARRVTELCPEVDVSVLADVTQTGRGSWDLRDMLAGGEIDFCYVSTGGFAAKVPALNRPGAASSRRPEGGHRAGPKHDGVWRRP